MEISVIIPIKTNINEGLLEFIEHYKGLSNELNNDACEIIIADGSDSNSFEFIDRNLQEQINIKHITLEEEIRTGDNDKLNGVYAALKQAKYDKILLIDDHFRISRNTIINLNEYFDRYDCFKAMPGFNAFPYSVLVDLAGIFIVNLLDYRKQYTGHLAFRKEHYIASGFPSRDALFDEYTMENHLRKNGYKAGFIRNFGIEAKQDITFNKFLEQRVRYAYENIAMPIRFIFHLSLLPIMLFLLITDVKTSFIIFLLLTLIATVSGLIGQLKYGRTIAPKYTFLFSSIWFWFYPITTWIALYKFFTGGIFFGGKKIKKAG